MSARSRALRLLAVAVLLGGCDEPAEDADAGADDAGPVADAGAEDAGPAADAGAQTDGGAEDAGSTDGGTPDAGPAGTPTWVGVGAWGFRSTTTDGQSYTTRLNPQQGNDHTPDLLRDVAYGGGVFVAVGGDRNSMIMRSTDGVTWAEDLQPSGTQWLGGVVYGGGRWVAVGGVGTLHTSDDNGLTWTESSARLPAAGRNVAYADGHFVAVGDGAMIAVSADGLTWEDRGLGGDVTLGIVEHGAGLWLVAGSRWNGSGFDNRCATSTDRVTWTDCPFSPGRFAGASVLAGRLVVRTDEGHEAWDGSAWSHSATQLPGRLLEAEGRFVGVDGARRYHGTSLDSLQQIDDAERSFRSFAVGFSP